MRLLRARYLENRLLVVIVWAAAKGGKESTSRLAVELCACSAFIGVQQAAFNNMCATRKHAHIHTHAVICKQTYLHT